MPTSEELTDAYVAALLARDADNLRRGIVTSTKPRDAPKPNTRFLRNIIRDTTSHNAALLEKDRRAQQESARERVRAAEIEGRPARRRKEERPDRWTNSLTRSGLLGGKREKKKSRRERSPQPRRAVLAHQHVEDADRTQHESSKHPSRSRSPRLPLESRDRPQRRRSPDSRHNHKKHRSRSRSPRLSLEPRDRARRRRSPDSKHSHKKHRSRSRPSPDSRHKYIAHQSRMRSPRPSPKPQYGARLRESTPPKYNISDDSDPLEEIVGPLPASRMRGRGRTAGASGIDARFQDSSYDPRADTDSAKDEDWGDALNAYRERAKHRSVNAERLLAAGFNETDVERWKTSTTAKTEDDVANVVWKKPGEAREWDRGKVMGEDGLKTVPTWAREEL